MDERAHFTATEGKSPSGGDRLMAAGPLIHCVEHVSDYGQFERLCRDLMALSRVRACARGEGLSRDDLAAVVGTNRNSVALLEQARRLPPAALLEKLCGRLAIPETLWKPLLDPTHVQHSFFEDAMGELVGRIVSIADHDEESAHVAHGDMLTRKQVGP